MQRPHKLDVGNGRLRTYLSTRAKAAPRLPLVHTTDSYDLRDIIENGKLTPTPCDVFTGESLIYLFYGRPSFRPNCDVEPLSLNHYYPICLIFDSTLPNAIRRVFPFDSGALGLGLYRSYLHRKMRLGDFLLTSDPDAPAQVVETFFATNDAYLKARPVPDISADPSQFEAHALSGIYNAKDSNSFDSRASSIEIQIDTEIDIYSHLQASIMPEELASSDIGNRLQEKGVDVLPYPIIGKSTPTEYLGNIHSLTLSYLRN